MSQHRFVPQRHRRRVLAAVLAVAALGGVAAIASTGVASAAVSVPVSASAASFSTAPVPKLNRGESASFQVADDGTTLTLTGQATRMRGDTLYTSLIYDNATCSATVGRNGRFTLDGVWGPAGASQQTLSVSYVGAARAAVRDHIDSVSIRALLSTDLRNNARGVMVEQPRACAAVPR